jgi:hypothetical protein
MCVFTSHVLHVGLFEKKVDATLIASLSERPKQAACLLPTALGPVEGQRDGFVCG